MKINKIVYTPNFVKNLRKLPQRIVNKADKKEFLFKQNAFHPSLKTHALSGSMKGLHSFSIDYSYRVVFKFERNSVTFIDVGTHGIYR